LKHNKSKYFHEIPFWIFNPFKPLYYWNNLGILYWFVSSNTQIILAFEKSFVPQETDELMNVLDNKDQIYKMEEREKRKFLG
jgi:hypothetical protein